MSSHRSEAKVAHLLALEEGLYELKEDYYRFRETKDYQEVFLKDEPLVSVCMATFNRAELLLERSLRSLVDQSYRNIEIIVVGDSCTDHTEEIIREFQDPRITFENLSERGPYPRPGKNRWLVAGTNAMNRALELANGDFVTHLDDDDLATTNRIERLLTIAKEERLDFLWHAFQIEQNNHCWKTLGSTEPTHGSVTTGSVFYHRYFSKIPWDVYAYRQQEPGDWNRIRKIVFLEPRMRFVDEFLLFHYREGNQGSFTALPGERFLEF